MLVLELDENELAKLVVNIAFEMHVKLGPGLYESVYEEILFKELVKCGLQVERQKAIYLYWDNERVNKYAFRADLIINNKLLIEVKSIEALADVHFKQVNTYLKVTGIKLGLIINFNVALIKFGIKRIVNGLELKRT